MTTFCENYYSMIRCNAGARRKQNPKRHQPSRVANASTHKVNFDCLRFCLCTIKCAIKRSRMVDHHAKTVVSFPERANKSWHAHHAKYHIATILQCRADGPISLDRRLPVHTAQLIGCPNRCSPTDMNEGAASRVAPLLYFGLFSHTRTISHLVLVPSFLGMAGANPVSSPRHSWSAGGNPLLACHCRDSPFA